MQRRRFLKWLMAGAALVGLGTGVSMLRAGTHNRYYSGPKSDHFDGTVFFNPDGAGPGRLRDLLRWQLGMSGGEGAPRSSWPDSFADDFTPAVPEPRLTDGLRVTMVGHATLLLQTAGLNILTDPVWSERASPFSFAGPKRVNQPGIAFDDLPPIDLVLLSHNHYDHLDLATLGRLVASHDPLIVTPLGNDTIIHADIPGARIHTMDWGDTHEVGGVLVHAEPVHHWSARSLRDRCMALWAGFVVETPGGKIYHVGDTGFHRGINYRAAAEKHGGFRLAVLPFGAYEPRWFMKRQHQNPEEAVEGMALCKATHVAGHHWATFQLTDEAIEAPRNDLHRALDAAGIDRARFRPLLPSEVWDVPSV